MHLERGNGAASSSRRNKKRPMQPKVLSRAFAAPDVACLVGNPMDYSSGGSGVGLPVPSRATITKVAWVTFSIVGER